MYFNVHCMFLIAFPFIEVLVHYCYCDVWSSFRVKKSYTAAFAICTVSSSSTREKIINNIHYLFSRNAGFLSLKPKLKKGGVCLWTSHLQCLWLFLALLEIHSKDSSILLSKHSSCPWGTFASMSTGNKEWILMFSRKPLRWSKTSYLYSEL